MPIISIPPGLVIKLQMAFIISFICIPPFFCGLEKAGIGGPLLCVEHQSLHMEWLRGASGPGQRSFPSF